MYKKILVPVDVSRTDDIIFEHVQQLARFNQAEVVLVHVSDGYAARFQNQLNLTDSEEVCKDREYLETMVARFGAAGVQAHFHLLTGEPVDGILALAKEERCDLIAMATHGHRFFQDWLLGSVADNLRHKTSLPILMLRAESNRKKS